MAFYSVAKLKKLQAEAEAFLNEQRIPAADGAPASRLHRFSHFWVRVINSFIRNRCPVRATALAYTTLLALIPVLAVVVSVSTSLLKKEGEAPIRDLIDQIVANVAPQLDLMTKTNRVQMPSATGPEAPTAAEEGRQAVVKKITEFINNISTGTLGVTGIISLILVAILLLSTIESTFNDIWGVTRGRTWYSRVVHYWTAITLGPLILIVTQTLNYTQHLKSTSQMLETLPLVGSMIASFFLGVSPFVILTFAFALFYQLMPNTRVQWPAALVGGAVGGVLWQLNNLFSIIYVSNVITYSKIYGGFGMVPIFLVGIYLSWLILLFGAQVAYAFQNRRTYLQEKQAEAINQRGRELIALRLMTRLGCCFQQGKKPPTVVELSDELQVPQQLVTRILTILGNAHLVFEGRSGEGYVPGRPLDLITCEQILLAMRAGQGTDAIVDNGEDGPVVRQEFDRIAEAEKKAASTTLQFLVNRISPAEACPVPSLTQISASL